MKDGPSTRWRNPIRTNRSNPVSTAVSTGPEVKAQKLLVAILTDDGFRIHDAACRDIKKDLRNSKDGKVYAIRGTSYPDLYLVDGPPHCWTHNLGEMGHRPLSCCKVKP